MLHSCASRERNFLVSNRALSKSQIIVSTGDFILAGLKLAQPLLDHRAVFLELLSAFSFEAQHQSRLGIGGADESPTIGELDPHTIHIDNLIVMELDY